jgi:hypothetical protein
MALINEASAMHGNALQRFGKNGNAWQKMQRMATLSNNFFHGKILTNLNLTESFS